MLARGVVDAPVRLVVLVVLVAVLPLSTLGWLGWRSIDQGRDLEAQRLHDRLENSVAVIARHFDSLLAEWEHAISAADRDGRVTPPQGTAVIVFDSRGGLRASGIPLPYYPLTTPDTQSRNPLLDDAERTEFQSGSELGVASDKYRRAAAISQGAPRAAALVGLARTLKKQGLTGPALDAYRALASLGAVSVAGWPAELEAHRQRRKLYEGIGDHQSGLAESELIRTALAQCRFQIDKVTFDSYAAELPTPPNVDPVGLRLAEAAAGLWTTFDGQSSGRMSFSSAGGAVTAAWKRTDDRTAVILSPTTALMASAQPVANDLRVAVVLEGDTGQRVAGTMAPGAQTVARTTRESSLPWAVRVAATDADALQKAGRARDRILGAAFGLMVLIIGASAYVVSRSLMRELEVARLQSDFVAAVSHEFRTPLTAMRHMTEVLEEDSADAAQRPRYFRALAKETRRLHNLVESLLDFRKMEEGRPDFQAVDLDPNALVRELVGQLREGLPERRRIILQSSAASLFVQGDWDALALALRNVIDNALKYSPVDTPVTVSVERRGGDIAISVDDHGPGIPASEQRAVFRKFVRGASTKALNVKGTGIGLTMADRIVRTHAGRLELESDGRSGCRFTILLPLRNIAAGTAEAASSANT